MSEVVIFEPYYLSEYRETDVQTVVEAMNNDDITRTLAGPPFDPYLWGHGEQFVKLAMSASYKGIKKVWAIRDKTNDKLIGSIDIRPSDDDDAITKFKPTNEKGLRAGFGFWLHPDYWGKRIMTTALKQMIDQIGKKQMDIHSFNGDCFKGNTPSRKVFENNGFRLVEEQENAALKQTTGKTYGIWLFERIDN